MQKESLEVAIEEIVKHISEANIDVVDKTELLLNLHYFLKPEDYDENLKVLMQHQQQKKLTLKMNNISKR